MQYKQLKYETDFGLFSGTGIDDQKIESDLNKMAREGYRLVSTYTIEKVKGGTKYVFMIYENRTDYSLAP